MQDRYSFEKGAHRERYSEYRDQPRLRPRGTRAVYERPLQSQGPILARKPRYPTEEPRPGVLLRVSCSSLVIKPQVKSLRISKKPKGSELFREISRNLCQNRPSRDYFSGGSTFQGSQGSECKQNSPPIATGLPKRPSPPESRLRESPGIRSAVPFSAIPAMCGQSAFSDAAHFESSGSLGDNHAARPGCCRTSLRVRRARVQKG